MLKPILTKLDALDGDLEQLYQTLQAVDQERFNQAPHPDKWSAAQILNHVMRAEELSLKYCQKKLSFQPQLNKAGLGAGFRSALVHYCMKLPFKFEAPPGMGTDSLPATDEVSHVFESWHQHRNNWRTFFKELPEAYLDKEVYKHPVGGRLSWMGMLRFFKSHCDHHRPQIDRALNL